MNIFHRLFARYVDYHKHGPLMLRYLSVLGFTAIPLYYLLRFTKAEPQYNDWLIRTVVTVLCIGLFLRDRWPARLKPFYYQYSYLVLIIGLPTTITFTSLHHGGGPIAVANTMMAAALVMLLTDWRNMIVVLLSGISLGTFLYLGTALDPHMPVGYLPRLPVLMVMLLGGSLIKHALEQASAERVREAYASLAGSIAHEMRNPLGQLKYVLENIESVLPPPSTKAQAHVLKNESHDALYRHIAQGEMAVQRGLQVISMTLDEVHQKPLRSDRFAHFYAGEACTKAVEEFSYEDTSQRERVCLQIERDFVFHGDETAFLFVLFNLIKNALAYPRVQLRITVDDGQVRVSDNGPGIAPEALGSLFQPFQTSGKKGGTGLGLAYCQRVMHAFGGRISCSSVVGESTCFTLEFPAVTAVKRDALRDAVLRQARGLLEGRRLLVVDDHVELRTVTRQKLLPTGVAVDEAANGEQALAMLARSHYDLVVLDLNMPGLDGYEVVERIRAGYLSIDRNLRVVAHTSEPAAVAQVKTRKAGMNGFVSKPCEQVVLLQVLCRVLRSSPAAQASGVWQLAGRSVLLADDSAYNLKAVATYLQHAGMTVTEAGSGQEALTLLRSMNCCDAVLLDIEMPGMSGLEVARRIRSSDMDCRNVPILALTAHSEADMATASMNAGMSDLLVKPVDMASLYGKLLEWLAPAVGVSAPELQPIPAQSTLNAGLLDIARLENYHRLGVLDELISDFLPVIKQHVGKVTLSASENDLAACRDALHSLIGMSGEAGAQALCQLARRIYLPVKENRWPALVDWTESLQTLAGDSYRALDDYVTSART